MTLINSLCETVLTNEPMKRFTSFKIGGPADFILFPKTTNELINIRDTCKKNNLPLTILGDGANVLVSDDGIRGVVVFTNKMNTVEIYGSERIRAMSGVRLSALADAACSASLEGLAFASGIPGTVGGAIAMNAGAYSQTISDNITQICIYDCNIGEEIIIPKHKAKFEYRSSIFKDKNCIILWADFEFSMEIKYGVLLARQGDFLKKRRTDQPLDCRSCGSVFKNPKGHRAWKLIDDSGLRGFSVGDAQISEKHTNFIVNHGNATAEDVRKVIAEVRKTVKDNFNILLEPEVVFLGEFDTKI